MYITRLLLATFILAVLPFSSKADDTYLNELKIGLYAKDYKKIYHNLNLHLSKDKSNTEPEKWMEIGDLLVEMKDYSSAWQFYLQAVISIYQNDTFSKREKSDIFDKIIEKTTEMMNNIDPLEKMNVETKKFSIYPGEENNLSRLANMLKSSKQILVPGQMMIDPQTLVVNKGAVEDVPVPNENSFSIDIVNAVVLVEDEAPYYDYTELQANLIYPNKAYKEKIEGKVLVEVTLDEKGDITSKKIKESTNEIFNDNALLTIDKVKFKPALHRGQPILSRITVPVYFNMK